jgi:hypothetical protein
MEIYVIYLAHNDQFIKKLTFGHGNTNSDALAVECKQDMKIQYCLTISNTAPAKCSNSVLCLQNCHIIHQLVSNRSACLCIQRQDGNEPRH